MSERLLCMHLACSWAHRRHRHLGETARSRCQGTSDPYGCGSSSVHQLQRRSSSIMGDDVWLQKLPGQHSNSNCHILHLTCFTIHQIRHNCKHGARLYSWLMQVRLHLAESKQLGCALG
jgi:hypothetical protein